jgi:hypothetical protein
MTAQLLTETCSDVAIEPILRPLDGEHFQKKTAIVEEEARLDISARGFWHQGERAFFDIRVFYPNASSNLLASSLSTAYRNHECEKKRTYGERVREVEHKSFTPIVLSSTGGMGTEAMTFYKRLASMLADKHNKPYSQIINTIKCRLNFSLSRSAVLCIRGTRSSKYHPIHVDNMELISHEAYLMM